jgi:small subunit ribosomal protein S16
MLTLKLKRIGKKHQGSFRLIVDEKRHKLYGKNVEDLGWHNPHSNKSEFKKDRIEHWLKKGAKTTDTVHNLLISAGVISGKKIAVHKQPKAKKAESVSSAPAQASVPEAK